MSDTIDLNSAALEQLDRLPGINDELAGRIVSYRDEHGPFGSLDDLRHVAGINEAIVLELLGENPPGQQASTGRATHLRRSVWAWWL
jgi:competence ComEA-like helix-hairpin-helix protein